jgi:phospholipid/cholesterol/gamma-HCH transport system substrate-binding protein
MDERTLQIRVGIVVIVAALATFLLVLFFREKGPLFHSTKTVYMRFDQAPGASPETPIRKNGVLVGRVSKVELLPEGGVVLTAWINDKYTIKRNEMVVIRTGSLIGDAVLEFVPSRNKEDSSAPIEDLELIGRTAVANDPISVLTNLEDKFAGAFYKIELASEKIAETAVKISQLADNANAVVNNNSEQFQRIISKTEIGMDHFHSAMTSIDSIVGDPELRVQLKKALQGLPSLLEDSKATLTDARSTLESFRRMSDRADATLENLQQFTEPLAGKGEKLVESAQRAIGNIDQLLGELVSFSQALNSNEGSLGRMIHDRELYDRLGRAAQNLESSSRRLEPILADVKIFTDKLARDPGQLGARGLLDRRPAGAGVKFGTGEYDREFQFNRP